MTKTNPTARETPDLSPIKLNLIDSTEASSSDKGTRKAIMVSKFIGIKVLLNFICQSFNVAPTKVQLFLVFSDGSGRKDIKEL